MNQLRIVSVVICAVIANAAPVHGAGILIGFTNVQGVSSYPQSLMAKIGQFKWFFAHASVGDNMMSGITDLYDSNTNFYRLRRLSDDATPPSTTHVGMIYDYGRGNPGWQPKFDGFTTFASNGWRSPKVNILLNKLCYIDQTADLNYYINSMTDLEGRYPDTLIVYATIPLTTSSDNDNYLRNIYNDALRGWVCTNNRVLFDIADIEAHDTNGTEYTFTNNSKTCQRLYDGNSSDGGHLNAIGCRQVAQGFYALAAALLGSDRDKDGMSDGEELIAGMCPTSSASVFMFECPSVDLNNGTVISWPSSSNRFYLLQRTANLVGTQVFTNLLTNAVATPPMNCYTDSPAGTGPFFYRVSVRQ
jgi:hypothetical protein